ncbi:hypothetical protein [Allorhizobium taibaishanense]|uniref:Uncharacterized protein n=1 Tax=Allorhizobium taibaishanense TaxID=887144 RepID=A0A7W6MWU5_9HYPH|nr:hypothetical protein [Allorhizobium taibaishanense]MBB4010550.1 hypothetical protein [Allorhizobium taibaishanense]
MNHLADAFLPYPPEQSAPGPVAEIISARTSTLFEFNFALDQHTESRASSHLLLNGPAP